MKPHASFETSRDCRFPHVQLDVKDRARKDFRRRLRRRHRLLHAVVLGFELVEDRPTRANDGTPKRWVVVRPKAAETGILLAAARGPQQTHSMGHQTADRSGFFLRVQNFRRDVRAPGGQSCPDSRASDRRIVWHLCHVPRYLRERVGSTGSGVATSCKRAQDLLETGARSKSAPWITQLRRSTSCSSDCFGFKQFGR